MAPAPRPPTQGVAGWALLVLALLVASWFGAPGGPPPAVEAGPAPTVGTGVPRPATADDAPQPKPPRDAPPANAASATAAIDTAVDPASGLPFVDVGALPPEARETLARIDAGGPFPFERDGVVFQNREGILPARPRGTYHEYTVVTEGLDHRGARRVVAEPSAGYYTEDHYASFRRIRGWP